MERLKDTEAVDDTKKHFFLDPTEWGRHELSKSLRPTAWVLHRLKPNKIVA